MAKLGNRLKLAVLKGMEAVGKGASNLASNAHMKVSEINLETRRREILSEFTVRAHELWQKGVELPQPLGDMMTELNDLDEKLSVLRAQRYAKVEDGKADEPEAQTENAGDEASAPEAGDEPVTEASDEPTEDAQPETEAPVWQTEETTAEQQPKAPADDEPRAEGDNA